mgnify:CR=1 FL=1
MSFYHIDRFGAASPVASRTISAPVTKMDDMLTSLRGSVSTGSMLVRTNRLIATLRRQKKQTRLVRLKLASLRELQNV